MPTKKEYIDKNKEAFEKLHALLDDGGVKLLIVSAEMRAVLCMMPDAETTCDELIKYKKVRVIMDMYLPAGFVACVKDNDFVRFRTTCLCGIWEGDPHP